MTVTTRFAPSPTGFLHIGGARTALFNWLFAKHQGGEFLLRIEDTDRKRSTQEAIDAILEGMNWLGLNADKPAVFQSQQVGRHTEVAEQLLRSGKAYKCYVTPEELAVRRDQGQAILAQIKSGEFNGKALDAAKQKANALLAAFRSPYRDGGSPPSPDTPYVIRLRAPDSGRVEMKDRVQGDVGVSATEIDDLILMRADGTPTYMLAVVVDDHDMGITQVIRGDDHLTNTFRQIPIYQAMEWSIPDFAHIPLIHGPDGAKLSKRHGALGVEAYRDMGYLPEGLKNYLLRLGWSHGDDEFITEEKAIEWFDLDAVNKGASRMDFEKLGFINAQHIKACPEERLLQLVLKELTKAKPLTQIQEKRVEMAISSLSERGQTIPDIAAAAQFLLIERPIEITGKARKKLKSDALDRLKEFKEELEHINNWSAQSISDFITTFCESRDISLGQIGPHLRAAMTGNLPSPDLNLILFWLGKSEVIARIDDVLSSFDGNE